MTCEGSSLKLLWQLQLSKRDAIHQCRWQCIAEVPVRKLGQKNVRLQVPTLLALLMHSLSLAMALAILCRPAAMTLEKVLDASTLASLPSLLSLRLTY